MFQGGSRGLERARQVVQLRLIFVRCRVLEFDMVDHYWWNDRTNGPVLEHAETRGYHETFS
jgi:hypothetical protein